MSETPHNDYSERLFLQQILGYSYDKNKYCLSSGKLFSKETFDGYIFSYNTEEAMKSPYISICFHITWDSKNLFPSEVLLARLGEYKIFQVHEIAILMYNKADIVFALHPIEYPYLCELMNTLVCWIAEKQKNLPVKIDEKILYSKMDSLTTPP